MVDRVVDGTAIVTAVAAAWAAAAATFAGFYAKKAYEAAQEQIRIDRRTLETTQQQMRANQRPFLVPQNLPVFGTGTQRADLLDMSHPQQIGMKNIGYGPACNISVRLCGKRPPYIVANDYGLLGASAAFPLAIQETVTCSLTVQQREPNRSLETPDGYDGPGDVTVSIARLVITYTDVALNAYQSIYELIDNREWDYRTK